jgi:hypothetical protein
MPQLSGPGPGSKVKEEARQRLKWSHGCSAAATPAQNGGCPLRKEPELLTWLRNMESNEYVAQHSYVWRSTAVHAVSLWVWRHWSLPVMPGLVSDIISYFLPSSSIRGGKRPSSGIQDATTTQRSQQGVPQWGRLLFGSTRPRHSRCYSC